MTPDRNPILSYDTEQRLRAALAEAAGTDGLRAPERVETALVAELRRRNRRILAGRTAAVGALAAAVMFGLFLTQPTKPVAPPPIAASATIEKFTPVPSAPPVALNARVKRRRAPRPVEQRVAAVDRSEFIPVGPWQAMEPMERGSIIRVRLPKSSLPGFGIPVSADRWHETIPADIVLAEDGSMRAVRFVNTRQ